VSGGAPELPSERSFGLLFGGIGLALAGWWLWHGRTVPALVAAPLGLAFAALALFRPRLLAPLNRAWFELGLLLGRIVNPVVLSLLFFLVMTPVALLLRLSGRDPLRLRLDRAAPTYWIERDPPGPPADSFDHQY
jgi:hypothetical protein